MTRIFEEADFLKDSSSEKELRDSRVNGYIVFTNTKQLSYY